MISADRIAHNPPGLHQDGALGEVIAESSLTVPARRGRIEDFGVKIGGARKDFARKGAQLPIETAGTPAGEVWPCPEWAALIAQGHHPLRVRAVAELRTGAVSVSNGILSTSELRSSRAAAVEILRDHATTALLSLPIESLLVGDRDKIAKAFGRALVPTWEALNALFVVQTPEGPRLSEVAKFDPLQGYRTFWPDRFARMLAEVERGWPASSKQWAIRFAAEDPTFNAGKDRAGTWFVRIADQKWAFGTEAEAFDKCAAHCPRLAFVEPTEFVPLVVARRQGLADLRRGANVTPDEFLSVFGVRGVEWGNWVAQSSRAEHLNQAYDALLDLSSALGMQPAGISLGGSLALAFGARGRRGAAAHYEPDLKVINLSRRAGLGTLAHEWFHALDHFLFEEFQLEALGCRGTRPFASAAKLPGSQQGNAAQAGLAQRLSVLQRFLNGEEPTTFHRDAVSIDNQTGGDRYWSLAWELGARSFSAFVEDRLRRGGGFNEYLVHSTAAEAADFRGFAIYPFGDERAGLNTAWARLIAFLRKEVAPRSRLPALPWADLRF